VHTRVLIQLYLYILIYICIYLYNTYADPVGDYVAINQELALFSEDLAKKPQVRTTKNVTLPTAAHNAPASPHQRMQATCGDTAHSLALRATSSCVTAL
jgi:hypothetical protein